MCIRDSPTAITQNVEYLLDSVLASTMLSNSELIVMLNQAAADRGKLGELLNISREQMGYITNAEAGCGLLRYGGTIVPFANRFPDVYKRQPAGCVVLDGEEAEAALAAEAAGGKGEPTHEKDVYKRQAPCFRERHRRAFLRDHPRARGQADGQLGDAVPRRGVGPPCAQRSLSLIHI